MQFGNTVEFRTLLSEEEYNRLMEKFEGNHKDLQTHHYFDTRRFSLKAHGASLRVIERESLSLTLKKKKGYNLQEFSIEIDENTFNNIRQNGNIPEGEVLTELTPLINEQKVINFLSISTLRMFLTYKNGVLFIDKSNYLDQVDYELVYETKSHNLKDFVRLIGDFELQYKKTDKKIRRAFKAYKRFN